MDSKKQTGGVNVGQGQQQQQQFPNPLRHVFVGGDISGDTTIYGELAPYLSDEKMREHFADLEKQSDAPQYKTRMRPARVLNKLVEQGWCIKSHWGNGTNASFMLTKGIDRSGFFGGQGQGLGQGFGGQFGQGQQFGGGNPGMGMGMGQFGGGFLGMGGFGGVGPYGSMQGGYGQQYGPMGGGFGQGGEQQQGGQSGYGGQQQQGQTGGGPTTKSTNGWEKLEEH